jgi:A/G-specific adenine glycosylase
MNMDVDDSRLPSAGWKQAFRRRLLSWYRRHARDLPWRQTRDPYSIWVSEIMLQQTQVATVTSYYPRFLAALPTVAHLAAAPESQVLRLWEGLGYYRRARQLHRAAQVVVHEHAGEFPRDLPTARSLPGIGRYTAGAILSIAFDLRHPILEANTFRLLARLLAYRHDPQGTEGSKLLWSLAEALLPARHAGTFNQALMELGSTICTPRNPRCDVCPVMALCPTHAQGLQAKIPWIKPKRAVEAVEEVAIAVRRRGRVLLVLRGGEGRWAGLWDFPRFALDGESSSREMLSRLTELTGIRARPVKRLATIKHGVTRFRITLDCQLVEYIGGKASGSAGVEMRWLKPSEMSDYPLSVTGRKLSRLVIEEMRTAVAGS